MLLRLPRREEEVPPVSVALHGLHVVLRERDRDVRRDPRVAGLRGEPHILHLREWQLVHRQRNIPQRPRCGAFGRDLGQLEFVAAVLESAGCTVRRVGGSGDYGDDLLVTTATALVRFSKNLAALDK